MDFPYVDPKGDLAQGDVLKTSPELQKILSTYHPYYVENKENRFFVVLTQSCDLVRRRSGIGTRYLSLAPVRSAQQVIERQLKLLVDGEIEAEMPIGEERARARFEQFLSRLINNNEPDFFFFRADTARELSEDHCAILRLAISIRAEEHYETCLKARFLSIDDTFRAKLGWLVGELYSRVGTEDWPESHVRAKTQELIDGAAVWLDSRRLKQVKKLLEEWKRNNPGKKPSKSEIDSLIRKTKDRKAESIARTVEILQQSPELLRLASAGQLPADIWQKLEQRLTADPKLTTALR